MRTEAGQQARAASNGGRYGRRSTILPGVPTGALPRPRMSDGVEANTMRMVSLNCRTDAKPAANAMSANASLGRLDQQPGGVGAVGAGQGQRPGAQFGGQHAGEVAFRVAEPGGQAGHAVAFHDAVADQAHRAAGQVGAQVPLG